MKCPHCGAASDVLSTRVYEAELLTRRRECFNGHRFPTYEVFAGNIDRRTIADTRRGVEAKRRAHARRVRVLANPDKSATELARELGITEARVRQLR